MKSILLLFLVSLSSSENTNSKSRTGKFSLFNIIQFKNDPCDVSDTETGICYTTEECSSRGGESRNSCAAGFGTCCLFRGKDNAETFDAPISYFSNPSYPKTDWMPNYSSFTIRVSDPDVCQLRLDFAEFHLSGPSLITSPFGHCLHDRMAIFSSRTQNLGLSGGNLLCGDMKGQHIYIPVNATSGNDLVRLFAMVGGGYANPQPINDVQDYGLVSNYTWNIQVRQIDCTKGHPLEAPPGCLQYFTQPTDTIESFNFAMDGNPYPANLDYAICIKRQPGFCGINLGRVTPTDGVFKMNTNGNSNAEPFGRFCYDFTGVVNPNISSDYLAVLGASTFLGRYPVESAYFCGIFDGVNQVFPGIFTSYPGPTVINVRTDNTIKNPGITGAAETPQEALTLVQAGVENGFRLTYTQNTDCFRETP